MSENPLIQKPILLIKKFLPRSLFGRSLMIIMTPILLIQIIATFVFFDRHWSKMAQRLSFAVAADITAISYSLEQDPSAENMERIIKLASQHLDLLVSYQAGATLEEQSRAEKSHVWATMVGESLATAMNNQLRRPFILDVDFEEKWVQVGVQLEGGVLNLSVPQRRLFSSSAYIFLLWMIGVSAVLLVIAILFMRGQIRPIRKLAVAADRFGKGWDAPSFKPTGAREVRQAAEAFIKMRERIQRQISQRTDMLAGVSHDLRTPITRLKLQLEMMGDTPDIRAMKQDLGEMEKMIAGYLDFVRGEGHEQPKLVDLASLLEKLSADIRRQGVEAEIAVEPGVQLMLRPMAFERALSNIVSNAMRYADHIWMTLHGAEQRVEIIIEDNGPGIPAELHEEVFKPFYRGEAARDTAEGSVGLGLPIAQDIVHAHGGHIELSQSQYGGLRVRIILPL